jgi:serine/threonine protein kinase
VQGQSLSQQIKAVKKHVLPSRRQLPPQTTITIMTQVLDALDYAHRQDIVHRDIKPGNILMEAHSKRPIVLDFGIAKITRGLDDESGMILGTPVYMPPEQIRNETIDGRADIYACGVMLFEMLVSDLPLPRIDPVELLFLKLKKKDNLFHRKPSELNPMVHPAMDKIVFRAISFDPAKRYPSCAEFREALLAYESRHLRKTE